MEGAQRCSIGVGEGRTRVFLAVRTTRFLSMSTERTRKLRRAPTCRCISPNRKDIGHMILISR